MLPLRTEPAIRTGRSEPARPNPEALLPNLPGSERLKLLVKPLLRQVHRVGDPGHRLEANEVLRHASAPAAGAARRSITAAARGIHTGLIHSSLVCAYAIPSAGGTR